MQQLRGRDALLGEVAGSLRSFCFICVPLRVQDGSHGGSVQAFRWGEGPGLLEQLVLTFRGSFGDHLVLELLKPLEHVKGRRAVPFSHHGDISDQARSRATFESTQLQGSANPNTAVLRVFHRSHKSLCSLAEHACCPSCSASRPGRRSSGCIRQ